MQQYFTKAAKMCGHDKTYKELKNGVDTFDLDIWSESKAELSFAIDFACREKDIVSGVYTCHVCKGNKVYTQSIQTRSADEGTSLFVLCANSECKNKKPWQVT